MSRALPLCSLLLALLGCRVEDDASEPIEDHVSMCCKSDGPEGFSGCRQTNRCRTVETIWIRGPLTCGPIEPETCKGGRCCELALPLGQAPTELEPPPTREAETPAPVPIQPMPYTRAPARPAAGAGPISAAR